MLYIGKVSERLANKLKSRKYTPAFYNRNTIANLLFNSKDKVPPLERSGIYRLSCNICGKLYVGQSGRAITTRLAEHERSWRLKKRDSTFAEHAIEECHAFDINCEVLHRAKKGRKLTLLEILCINKHQAQQPDLILNDQTQFPYSPLLK